MLETILLTDYYWIIKDKILKLLSCQEIDNVFIACNKLVMLKTINKYCTCSHMNRGINISLVNKEKSNTRIHYISYNENILYKNLDDIWNKWLILKNCKNTVHVYMCIMSHNCWYSSFIKISYTDINSDILDLCVGIKKNHKVEASLYKYKEFNAINIISSISNKESGIVYLESLINKILKLTTDNFRIPDINEIK